jgi:hypothetical protein
MGFVHGYMIETLSIGILEVDVSLQYKHLARHGMTSNLEKVEHMVVKHELCWAALPHGRVVKCQLTNSGEEVGIAAETFIDKARKK